MVILIILGVVVSLASLVLAVSILARTWGPDEEERDDQQQYSSMIQLEKKEEGVPRAR